MRHSPLFFVITTLFLASVAIAPSHPVFIDIGGGVAPDSPFYFFDTLYDDFRLSLTSDAEEKARLAAEISAERLAESYQMIEQNNLEAAQIASQDAQEHLEIFTETVQTIPSTEVEMLAALEELVHYNNEYAEAIQVQLEEKVEAGEITQEQATVVQAEDLVDQSVETQADFAEKKGELVEAIAQEEGITVVEAELAYKTVIEENGVDKVQQGQIAEELVDSREMITKLEEDYRSLEEGEEKILLGNIIEKTKLDLQQSESLFELGDYDEAFDNLAEAQDEIVTCDDFIKNQISEEEKASLAEEFGDREAINKEVEEENVKFVEEWEANKATIQEKYPEQAEVIGKEYEQAKKVVELASRLEGEYSNEFENLKSEGRSDDEATRILTARFSDEYRKAYGEEFLPPGFVVQGKVNPVDPTQLDDPAVRTNFADKEIVAGTGGGFVVGTQYTDPVSGYKYEFIETGWRYTTSSGQAYEQKYPEGYVPPKTYTKGNEMYNYKVETPEGTAEYVYTATGYEVIAPDGNRESYAYSPGKYKMPDGRAVEYKPTGYEIKTGAKTDIKYDYNPEYKTYVAQDGTIYRPPEGATYHNNVKYDSAQKDYSYQYGSETWTYDPAASSWKSSGGETYKPATAVVAPVGYEDKKSYTTEAGKSWNFDEASKTWKASTGESYNENAGQYKTATGVATQYNYDSKQHEYEYDHRTGEYKYEQVATGGSGAEWKYDPTTSAWLSSGGETVQGGFVPQFQYPTPTYISPSNVEYPTPTYVTPGFTYPTPYYTYPSPSYVYPTPGSYLSPYPTPFAYQYPTPGQEYITPYYSYPTPGEFYHTPSYYSYPTPSEGYPTPSYTYPSPYYAYPTPSGSYPTPTYSYPSPSSYPTPSYSYPTPGEAYTYPSPSTTGYSYPSPSYPTPYLTPSGGYTYPSPSYPYPTPTTSGYTYPSPSTTYPYPTPGYSYPTPSETHSYPTPSSYSYPTPSTTGYSYPTPSSYSYPTPSEGYPTPTSYSTPYGTPTSYSSPYSYPTPSEYHTPS